MTREETIGECRLLLGDARDLLPTIGRVDAVVTDPPYGISLQPQRGLTEAIAGDGREDAKALWREAITAVLPNLSPNSAHLFWTGWSETWTKDLLAEFFTVKSCVVWAKNMWGIGYYTRPQHEFAWYCHLGKPPVPETADSDLWNEAKIQAPIHSCEKPVSLMTRCLRLTGGDVILDPFMGVGSTGVACVKLGRKFIGIEIEPKYFDIACKRIEAATKEPRLPLAEPKMKQTSLLDSAR